MSHHSIHRTFTKIAFHLDVFRVIPRFVLIGYSFLFWEIVHWFMALQVPTINQTSFVSIIVGLAGTLFAFYLKSGRNPTDPDLDLPPVLPPTVLPGDDQSTNMVSAQPEATDESNEADIVVDPPSNGPALSISSVINAVGLKTADTKAKEVAAELGYELDQ